MGLSRFELLTSRLSGVRSNQLSYRPTFSGICRKIKPLGVLKWPSGQLLQLLFLEPQNASVARIAIALGKSQSLVDWQRSAHGLERYFKTKQKENLEIETEKVLKVKSPICIS